MNVHRILCVSLLVVSTHLVGCAGGSMGKRSKAESALPSTMALRAAAQWEPALGLVIAWPLAVSKELIIEVAKDDQLYLMVAGGEQHAEAKTKLTEWGANLANVHFIEAAQCAAFHCTSDWGPITVFDQDKAMRLVDPSFRGYPWADATNQPRFYPPEMMALGRGFPENSDNATKALATKLGLTSTQVDYSLCAGNLIVDGNDRAFTTEIMFQESRHHGLEDKAFLAACKDTLGFEKFFEFSNYEISGAQHITCVMKLLDEERMLVTRVSKEHPLYDSVEGLVTELEQMKNTFGRPYEILRIDAPAWAKEKPTGVPDWADPRNFFVWYIDSIILNKKVLVPLYGAPEDEAALATYREAMPGYHVLGFPLPEDRGAYANTINCRSVHVFDPEMIYLRHKKIERSVAAAISYPLEVLIRDYSEAGLDANKLTLYWRLQGEKEWRQETLASTGEPEMYSAAIPGPHAGRTIEYYLTAADESGRVGTVPRAAPEMRYTFEVR